MSTTDHKHDEGRDVRTGSTFAAVVFGVLATDSSATGPSSLRVVRVLWVALEFMVVVEEEYGVDGFCVVFVECFGSKSAKKPILACLCGLDYPKV